MKILHVGTLDVNAGGPAMSTYLTLKGLQDKGIDVSIAMFPLSKGGRLRGKDIPITFVKNPIERKFCFSHTLKSELSGIDGVDVYHAQGVWQWPTYALIDCANKKKKPYLITPRGYLYPQDIAKSSTFFKKLSLRIRLLKDLNAAACVHVTCEDEMIHCRNLGVTSPIAIIPNPVEIKEYPYKKEDNVRRIGYLGRISRRKNIEGLINAFHELGDEAKNAELLIIGGGDETYERYLRQLTERFALSNVRFVGFLSGEEKDKALASCSVLAMPSEFENLGNVVLEGLVRGIPCIATKGSPWSELQTHHCGWWVPYTQEDITYAVRNALNETDDKLQLLGFNGRKLMEERYSVEVIANQMAALYNWIFGEGNKPEFVF